MSRSWAFQLHQVAPSDNQLYACQRFDCQSCQSGMKPFIFFGGGDRNLSAYFVADRHPSSWIVFSLSFAVFSPWFSNIFCRSTPINTPLPSRSHTRSHGQEAELMKPFKVKFLEVGPAFFRGKNYWGGKSQPFRYVWMLFSIMFLYWCLDWNHLCSIFHDTGRVLHWRNVRLWAPTCKVIATSRRFAPSH